MVYVVEGKIEAMVKNVTSQKAFIILANLHKRCVELYFMRYLFVIIVLLNAGLYKPVFSTYSHGKRVFLSFCVL